MTSPDQTGGQTWQLVLVLWGTKYGADEVNHLIATICAHAAHEPRLVLITDRPRDGLDARVLQRPFPDFFLNPNFLRGGCQAKLAMFEAGVLPDDLPAVYVDIDTVVFGDLTRFLALQTTAQTVAILQSAILPFGALARWIFRLTKGKRYARGNSSIIVFHPAHCHFIAARFRALYGQYGERGFRPTIADERFISWSAQPHMRAIPRDMAVKLPTEFMLPWRWLILLRAALPWVRRRWDRLIAITLPGVEVKGEELLALQDGAEVVDRKGRILIWSDRALGSAKARLTAYYRALAQK
jgi:hypothetical protein